MKHPMQPVKEGRFVANEILLYLFKAGKIDLNEIAAMDFPDEDRRQLAQLLGYTVSGYTELSYVGLDGLLELEVSTPRRVAPAGGRGGPVISAALFTLLVLMRGFTVMLGIDWFLTPLGVPAVGVAHALGLSTLASLLCRYMPLSDDRTRSGWIVRGLILNTVALGMMWIFQLFM